MSSSDATHATPEPPDVDERLVSPETRYEIHDGALVHVAPADEPHGTRHSKLSALVEAHVGPELDVAIDMLTRTSETSDVAPDVSVFPRARDPLTGGRQIEQLAFEVVSTESLGHAGRKAQKLVERGVRRVFALDVERGRALEWSHALGTWSVLDSSAQIEDPALAVPLPIAALVRAFKADDAVARALIAKKNPEIEAVRTQDRAESRALGRTEGELRGRVEGMLRGRAEGVALGRAEGRAEGVALGRAEGVALGRAEGVALGRAEGVAEGIARGLAEAVLELLVTRSIPVPAAERARILAERDGARLRRWLARAASCTSLDDLLALP